VKSWEIIADNLSKAGWSWGCVSALDREGRTIWIVDAHRDDGKRYVVRADEKLTAFLELELAIHALTRAGVSSFRLFSDKRLYLLQRSREISLYRESLFENSPLRMSGYSDFP
jgi:hypothetical protein